MEKTGEPGKTAIIIVVDLEYSHQRHLNPCTPFWNGGGC